VSEQQLQRFLHKVDQLNELVARIKADTALRAQLSACESHQQVVELAADQGLEIGRRWGESEPGESDPPLAPEPHKKAALANLFHSLPPAPGSERVEMLLEGRGLKLELIHSCAASTPAGQWYNQPLGEWVLLLQGSAQLRFADADSAQRLQPGDLLWIPPHRLHRLESSDGGRGCLWLTLFVAPELEPKLPVA
jgi:cupin 2 domain-containing protein